MTYMMLALVIGVLACARVTRIMVTDRIGAPWRRWVVARWGPDSMPAYLAHCPWCTGMWVCAAVMPWCVITPGAVLLAILAPFAASYLVGMMAEREGGSNGV